VRWKKLASVRLVVVELLDVGKVAGVLVRCIG
jgi:hypothetical protein